MNSPDKPHPQKTNPREDSDSLWAQVQELKARLAAAEARLRAATGEASAPDANTASARQPTGAEGVQFRQLFEKMLNGYALHSMIVNEAGEPVDYRFLEINQVYESLTGLRREDVIGKTVLEVLPNLENFWIETYGRVALTGNPIQFVRYDTATQKYYDINAFCPELGHFAVIFADITERIVYEEEMRRRNQELSMLNQVVAAASSSLDPQQVLETIVRELAHTFDVPQVGIALLDASGDFLEVVAQYEAVPTASVLNAKIPITGNPSTEYVIQRMRPLAVADVQNDARVATVREFLVKQGVVSILILPMVVRGRVIGTVGLDSFQRREFDEREIELANTMASAAAQTIENAQLYDMTRRRTEELEALESVSAIVRHSLSQREIIPAILQQLCALFHARHGFLLLRDLQSGESEVAFAHGFDPPLNGADIARLLDRVQDTRLAQVFEHVQDEPDFAFVRSAWHLPNRESGEDCSAIGVALGIDEQSTGAIWLICQEGLSPDEVVLFNTISDIVASALQRSILYRQIQTQARRLKQTMEVVPAGLLLLDAEKRVLLANPLAIAELAILSPAMSASKQVLELAGQPIQDFLPENSGYATREVEVEKRQYYSVSAVPVDPEDRSAGWVILIQNVTADREIQQRILLHNRLAAVGQLAAGIAHDFNNIMGVILLYTQVLQRSKNLSETDKDRLTAIYQQSKHASGLIRQILDFGRQSTLNVERIELGAAIQEMTALWRDVLPDNIQVKFTHSGDDSSIVADVAQIEQMLMNLVMNARDAMMPAGGQVELSLDRLRVDEESSGPFPEMRQGDWVSLAIQDSGSGIPDEVLPRIFDPFFTTKEQGKGTGLGLAQVYGIVKQHDGHIHVETEADLGTRFTIHFPVALWAAERRRDDSIGKDENQLEPAESRTQTILLVENDPMTRTAARHILESDGYRVLMSRNGRDALDRFRKHKEDVDLVLSELVLPEIDGAALFQQLGKEAPDVKFVIMTGYLLPERGKKLLQTGVAGRIQKPFTIHELLNAVHSALESETVDDTKM